MLCNGDWELVNFQTNRVLGRFQDKNRELPCAGHKYDICSFNIVENEILVLPALIKVRHLHAVLNPTVGMLYELPGANMGHLQPFQNKMTNRLFA